MSRDTPPQSLRDRVVLVTGGSGFLGSALVQRLLASGTAEVRVLTRGPARTAASSFERAERLIVGDVRDPRVVREAVRGAHVVVHLAAIKSVERCEALPAEAIATNVRGTATVLDAALREPTLEKFIAVSSDKASSPTTVYGMTKAAAERMVADAQAVSVADLGTVRCGSLWGSTGSVLPVWLDAARAGTELAVTDPGMTRFVMLRTEAVDLIVEAITRNMGGSILAQVMPAYAVGDLAAILTEAHGVGLRVTGRRIGEKLDEDLVSERETPFAARVGMYFGITPGRRNTGTTPFSSAIAKRLSRDELTVLLDRGDPVPT